MSESGRPPTDASRFPEASALPYSRSRRLPPYRGIVAVDAKDFTGHPAVEHGAISRAIPELLRQSFEQAGLSEVWLDRRFPASTGDGYVFGFDPGWMPFVIHPWLHTLQELLGEFKVHTVGTVAIRLRVSLHLGPLPDGGGEFDGNGTPRNDTHRLLDSRPVKAVLADAKASVTHVAAILSDRCYQDAVESGYTGRHPDHFIEVPATVEGKRFDQRAWLYVPAPSGNLYDRRLLDDPAATGDQQTGRADAEGHPPVGEERRPAPAAPPTVQRADGGNVNSGTVYGGQAVTNTMRGAVGGNVVRGESVRSIGSVGGDYVEGTKGDTVHGDKHEHHR
ncbi:hypothetical protein ABT093_28875 [Kitasatospora sp. NPDC002551]|uniref:hypothetical protein n=1 Tax=unclassified Kitasatospora TaxID=2633591 RepID=UPI00333212D7